MDYIALTGIAFGLAMDAFAVSIADGAAAPKIRFRFALRIGAAFGFFQGFLPFLGWLLGKAGQELIQSADHWIALLLLSYLGGQMILESRQKRAGCLPERREITLRILMTQAVATSIDALATGVLLPSAVGASTPALMLLSVCGIGAVTFFLCTSGVYLGRKFGCMLAGRAETLGGAVLILIGIRIALEHVFFHP